MRQSHTTGADYTGQHVRIGIVSARFNGEIVESMREAAMKTLLDNGVNDSDITSKQVPGAFELPLACKNLADTNNYDGIIALGCVIRGDTPHFDYVCQGCTSGLQQVALDTNLPIAFGVLTTDTLEQAQIRSSSNNLGQNKGRDAALCVLEMINVLKSIGS